MKTRVTLQLVAEMERFDLRYTCDDCVHFAPSGHEAPGAATCTLGWPLGERRRALAPGDVIVFCKEFEP